MLKKIGLLRHTGNNKIQLIHIKDMNINYDAIIKDINRCINLTMGYQTKIRNNNRYQL